jgi:DNA invertase Pin-like site-specific DNA recombinase
MQSSQDFHSVKSIVTHRKDSTGNYEFKLQFDNDSICDSEWVKDKDCKCDLLISQYLFTKGISTAYLFCRVSTKYQAALHCVSLEAQEAELRNMVTMYTKQTSTPLVLYESSTTSVTRYSDNTPKYDRVKVYSISASAYKNIPDTLQMIGEAAVEGDAIMVWRVDRLSRNIVKYLSWCEEMKTKGVDLLSKEDNQNYTTDHLSFIQHIINANRESETLGKRVKLAYAFKKSRGDAKIGNLEYGKKYEREVQDMNDEDKTMQRLVVVDHPQEQETIKFVCTTYDKLLKNSVQMTQSPKPAEVVAQLLNTVNNLKRGLKWTSNMVNLLYNKYKYHVKYMLKSDCVCTTPPAPRPFIRSINRSLDNILYATSPKLNKPTSTLKSINASLLKNEKNIKDAADMFCTPPTSHTSYTHVPHAPSKPTRSSISPLADDNSDTVSISQSESCLTKKQYKVKIMKKMLKKMKKSEKKRANNEKTTH